MVQLNFNAQGVKPNVGFEPIPTGQYPVIITNSAEKPTKNGQGSYIEMEMTVQGGEHNGRKLFDRLNLKNPNQQAVDIAYGTLSAICHVTGVLHLQDTAQLHGRPFVVVAKKVERKDQPGSWSNEISGYKDMNGNDPGHAGTVAAPAAQPAWAQGQPAQPAPAQPMHQQPAYQPPPQAPAQQPQYAPPAGAPAAPAAPPAWAQGGQPAASPAPVQPQQQPPQQPQYQQPAGPAGAATAPPPWVQPQA